MSYHFSANQFDREFDPKRLGNWQVSKWYPDRPRQRISNTRIIADDRGHLLPGIPRFSEKPHERYITAWDFPRKITRKFAQEVTAPPPRKVAAWVQQAGKQPLEEEIPKNPETSKEGKESVCIPHASTLEKENILEDEEVPEKVEVSSQVTDKEGKVSPPRSAKSGAVELDKGSPPASLKSLSPIGSKSPSLTAAEREQRTETREVRNGTLNHDRQQPEDSKKLGEDVVIKGGELVEGRLEEEEEDIEVEDKMQDMKKPYGTGLEVTGSALGPPPLIGQKDKKQGQDDVSPLAAAYTPFMVAKQFAEENLRHHPLPDMISDSNYRLMESRVKYPGTVLPVPPRATAVSIRRKGAGPTHCTQSSIFRLIEPPPENPSTAIAPLGCKEEEKPKKKYNPKITHMDLAIGWDIKDDGQITCGPTGAAPSVFNIVPLACHSAGDCGLPGGCGTPSVNDSVHSPSQQKGSNHIEDAPCSSKQNTPPNTKPPSVPNSKPTSPPFSKMPSNQSSKQSSPQNSKPASASKPITRPNEVYNTNRKTSSLRSWERFGRPPVRKAWEEKENDSPNMIAEPQNQFRGDEIKTCMPNGMDSLPKVSNARKRRSQSSPNLSRNPVQPQLQRSNPGPHHKACIACHDDTKHKTNASTKNLDSNGYKMAFKAGKLSSNRPMTAHPSGSSSTSLSSQQDMKVKIPKPRAPFARRSYSISTLAPPFSLWPGNHKRGGRDYPDHWRLASVYQHAFKPIPNRTRPLLATVYQ